MSGKKISPSVQLAELTRGHVLPQEPIANFHMKVIADCIVEEWKALQQKYQGQLPVGEVATTTLLCSRLQNLRNPSWTNLVCNVKPGGIMNYDGTQLEKRPDLSLCLTRPRSPFNLEVECKLIDHPNGKTVKMYADKGLSRFLNGEYAWAAREAIMLGYVCDGSTIDVRLTPFLSTHKQSGSDPYSTEELPASVGIQNNLARSIHARNFSYPLHPSSPGPIGVWHLWL